MSNSKCSYPVLVKVLQRFRTDYDALTEKERKEEEEEGEEEGGEGEEEGGGGDDGEGEGGGGDGGGGGGDGGGGRRGEVDLVWQAGWQAGEPGKC